MSYIVTFDAEYSGPNPFHHHMLDLGAVLYRLSDMQKIYEFSVIINMTSELTWSEDTIKDFWLIKVPRTYYEDLRRKVETGQGVDMAIAMKQFVDFMGKCWEHTKGDIVIGSNRVDQDGLWLSFHLCKHGYSVITQIFGKDMRLIDLSSFHQGACLTLHSSIKDFEKSGHGFDCSEAAFRHFGIFRRPSTPKTHKALQDSENVAQAHCLIISAIQNIVSPQHNTIPKWPNKMYN